MDGIKWHGSYETHEACRIRDVSSLGEVLCASPSVGSVHGEGHDKVRRGEGEGDGEQRGYSTVSRTGRG